ncbi:MAG: sodium:proton antiporter [Planctomycetes bacterium]|nr:sodium:proton antiporter [Planctomycetota bacterium]
MNNILKKLAFGVLILSCTFGYVYAQSHTSPAPVEAGNTAGGGEASMNAVAHSESIGSVLPLWSVVPFALILLAIAVLPLSFNHWWEKNRNKAIIAAALSIPVIIYLLCVAKPTGFHGYSFTALTGATIVMEHSHPLIHTMLEYVSFIILLGSLFVISGGILIKGSFAGTPLVNTVFLAIGAVLASFIGTTGASMVLIRPLIRANSRRRDKAHIIVFFIFVVSNIGGLLTPLGDPPLFLGFLKGVPFDWTLKLWPQWAFTNGILLVVFNMLDQYKFNKEDIATPGALTEDVQPTVAQRLKIEGKRNILFLAGVVCAVYFSGSLNWAWGMQEAVMISMAVASVIATRKEVRQGNAFTYSPIIEVAVLFAGIFITMIPALLILNARGSELGLKATWHFFWGSGALSSFLDNAPTYLTFTATASGILGIDVSANEASYVGKMLMDHRGILMLQAISCGAVFMGANTYIGNGPNFMVKAVSEENGVKMPSFFGYMAYSICILIPIFVLVTFVFFRN